MEKVLYLYLGSTVVHQIGEIKGNEWIEAQHKDTLLHLCLQQYFFRENNNIKYKAVANNWFFVYHQKHSKIQLKVHL